MNYNQFSNLSCYEEFEIQCDLRGISKLDILKKFGNRIYNYYFFIYNDGIFNWYDLEGNHIEDPGILRELKQEYIDKSITKCVIPNSVTSICYDAFYNCFSLKEITIPDSVTSIDNYAFCNCNSLEEITIPNSVTSVDNYVFSWCKSLKEITIPNSCTRVGDDAFYNCYSLKEIIIPDNIKYIGYNAFLNCKSLEQVIFKGKILEEVKQMKNYPFGIEDENIIKCEV